MSENQNEKVEGVMNILGENLDAKVVGGIFENGANAIENIAKSNYEYKREKAKNVAQVAIEESRNNAKIEESRNETTRAIISDILKSDLSPEDKKKLCNDVMNDERKKHESDNQLKATVNNNEADVAKTTEHQKTIRTGIFVCGSLVLGGIAAWVVSIVSKSRNSNGIQMNLMTTGYLLNNVRVTEDLKCCYVDVLRAYGEMEALKNEEKDLWEQLVLLKRILETLIFKGTYGAKLKTGGRELKKLLNEIIIDSNHTGRWMQGLNEDERNELYSQAREIGKTLGLDAYKNR